MTLNYTGQVAPLEADGLTDVEIAERLSSDPSRYSDQPMTVAEIASRLADWGKDGAGITSRVMSAMDTVAETNRLVRNKLLIADAPGGTIALGNRLQRAMLQQFTEAGLLDQADTDALLSLAAVPEPYTADDVALSRIVHYGDQLAQRVGAAIRLAAVADGATEQSIRDAAIAEVG